MEKNLLLPPSVSHTVRAMCEDYDRRAEEIHRGKLPAATLGHYMMLNAAIDEALKSCCEEGVCEQIRRDIATQTGHRFTQLYYLSPGTYKDRKRKGKYAIAKALHLL
ncbi:MAG: hypothetical protein J6K61_04970 [Clostridia bacterium]|nr:hypothetical protein [Clostridia bacterium]